MNFHALSKEQKRAMKPIVDAIRGQLFGSNNNRSILVEGIVINFGKRSEPRLSVKVEILG